MKFSTRLLVFFLIILLSFISLADLIYRPGHPVAFDSHIHMTTMNQFSQALRDGEFPVRWANNFANFGHPLANIAHQTPAYLGAILILLGVSTLNSYLILMFFSIFLSSLAYFVFFRKDARTPLALTATALAVFFPYRELNIYTRGALPELMASIFLPLLLLGIWQLKQKNYFKAGLMVYSATFLTALTHPMMLVVFAPLAVTYFLFTVKLKNNFKAIRTAFLSVILAFGSSSYYLVPLVLEMKYFYQKNVVNSIGSDSFLSLKQLYDPSWYYTLTHPGPRGNYIKLGSFEFIILVLSFLLILLIIFLKNNRELKKLLNLKYSKQLSFWTILSWVILALTLPISKVIYQLPLVRQIQYPWRFLSLLNLTIPLVFIYLVKTIRKLNNYLFLLTFLALLLFFRVPQFYGKNYVLQKETDYQFNKANLHSTNLNTIWSDNSLNYQTKKTQAEIIEGKGELEIIETKNASRKYQTDSNEKLRIIDYTFYFPGWKVKIDDQETQIEYQDVNYRGLITYKVPKGKHTIKVVYQDTKVRLFSLIITGLALVASLAYLVISKIKVPT